MDQVRKDTKEIMSKPTTTGNRHQDDMRRLTANNIEAMGILYDELEEFKKQVSKFGESADKFSRSSRWIALLSLLIALASLFM